MRHAFSLFVSSMTLSLAFRTMHAITTSCNSLSTAYNVPSGSLKLELDYRVNATVQTHGATEVLLDDDSDDGTEPCRGPSCFLHSHVSAAHALCPGLLTNKSNQIGDPI